MLAPFPLLLIVFGLAVFAFLNAVPELVYLGRSGAAELLVESYRFIAANWIEWFPANLLLVAAVLAVDMVLPDGPLGLISAAGRRAGRGLLAGSCAGCSSSELTTSSRRAREFRRRAEGVARSASPCWASSQRSASIAAMQPVPAAVTAWR